MDRLDKGLIDIGLVVEPTFKEGYDYFDLHASDQSVLVMRRDSPLAAQTYIKKTS